VRTSYASGYNTLQRVSIPESAAHTRELLARCDPLWTENVASYKFALAKSLIDLGATGQTAISLEDLADPFSRHILEHLANATKQVTSASSRFLDACRSFRAGSIARDELLGSTVKLGFNHVIDAFHVVNRSDIPCGSSWTNATLAAASPHRRAVSAPGNYSVLELAIRS
jgi:hypothetical protein